MSRMSTVKKQNSRTWSNLHSRLRATPFHYANLMPEPIGQYINRQATSISSCEGYLLDSIIASTAFILAEKCSVMYNGMPNKTNLYVVFVGPPSTGKSQAISTACLDPLNSVVTARDGKPVVIGKSTSAGLVQKLSEGSQIIVSGEIFDVLNKMVKNDGDTASGDISLLSQLFSGEKVSVNFATQKARDIPQDRAFCILGAIQPAPLAALLTSLDTGNGFIERLLINFPDCIRPTPKGTKSAREALANLPTLSQVLDTIAQLHANGHEYVFDERAEEEVDNINESYIEQINAAVRDGVSPPQTKKLDLVVRVAPVIHVLSHVIGNMLNNVDPTLPSRAIKKESLDAAIKFVEFCESQKETYLCELRNITDCVVTPEVLQPKEMDVAKAILKTPGPIITFRAFKMSCPRALRSVNRSEYDASLATMNGLGSSSKHSMDGGRKVLCVFLKKDPTTVDWDTAEYPITQAEFCRCYEKKQPACISLGMQETLVSAGLVSRSLFKN